MTEWTTFFYPHFATKEMAETFVARCEDINRNYLPDAQLADNTPKLMMHQTVRLIGIADQTPRLRPYYDPLRLLFLMICAECVKKLIERYKEEGRSREFVRRFFVDHVSEQDKQLLRDGIELMPPAQLSDQAIVDMLYAVRCDVVHEGVFWGFSFATDDTPILNLNPLNENGQPPVTVGLRFDQLRDIVIRGCIHAIDEEFRNRQPGG